MKQESKQDIIRRLTEGLNQQQQSVPQLPAQARARKIKVLGAKTDPRHPFAGYAVGADESAEPGKKTIGPDKNDPFEKGWRAGFRHNESNPYPAGSKEAAQWDRGYAEAEAQPDHYDESLAKVDSKVAVSPFNDDHREIDQFVKEEWNRDRRGNWDGSWEVEMGVKPFYKAKIKAPTADFAVDKLRKSGVSGIKDATDDELNVRPGERNELDEVDTANTYESRLGEAKKRLAEAESRFVLYLNGKPQTHHATRAEAEKFADTVRAKMPDVKIEIKNEVREQGVAETTSDPKFDKMLKGITGKKAVAKQQKTDTKQQSRDAFGSMFGGTSADLLKNLKIREQGMAEGARVDRMVQHIASSEKATGKSAKDAENIAWATVNKRGMLDNKNKKKGVKEMKTPADIRAKNRAVVKKIQGKEVKEDITQEDIITKLKARLGDYLSDLGQQIKKDPALQDKLSAKPPGDQVGPAVKTVTTDDGHEISIHGNEDDGFRISIKNRPTPSKFSSLDEAVMACEMYCGHRRRQALNADYVEEA